MPTDTAFVSSLQTLMQNLWNFLCALIKPFSQLKEELVLDYPWCLILDTQLTQIDILTSTAKKTTY